MIVKPWTLKIAVIYFSITGFLMIFMLLSEEVGAAVEDGFEYWSNGDGTATITDYRGTQKDVVIPKELGGLTVTKIGVLSFSNKGLTSVTIPDSITTIEANSFSDNELTSIIIPDSVTSIEGATFKNNKLTSVQISNSVTSIGNGAFSDNQLESITIPDYVTNIGDFAFRDNQLTSIHLPDGLTSIGQSAFQRNQLTDLMIPDGVKKIGIYTFSENKLESVTIPDSVETIEAASFRENKILNLDLPNSVKTIGDSAFSGNLFTSLVIPENVESIGNTAFTSNNLTSVVIQNDSIELGNNAFINYTGPLSNITIIANDPSNGKSYAETNQYTFKDIETIPELIYEWKDHGDGTATITGYNGKGMNINIPNKIDGLQVTEIGDMAFMNKQIESVGFPEGITKIGLRAFQGNEIMEIEFPNSLSLIDQYAFANNQLTEVNIPESVQDIFGNAFNENPLRFATIKNDSLNFNSQPFGSNFDLTLIGHSNSTAETHAHDHDYAFLNHLDYDWIDHGDGTATIIGYNGPDQEIEIPNTLDGLLVTNIGKEAFKEKSLTKVVIPSSVRIIGEKAFESNNLTEVVMSDGVIEIQDFAFADNQLTHIIIPDTVETIMEGAFKHNQLEDLTLSKNLTAIGDDSFAYNRLTSINIPDSVTTIGKYAFQGNELTSLVIPKGVTSIKDLSFADNQLTTVVIPDSVTEILHYAFVNNQLTHVVIPDSVETIMDGAFQQNKLESITIPENLTVIHDFLFLDNQLESIVIPRQVKIIGQGAFAQNQLTSVIIPKNVESIEMGAFWNNNLNEVIILNDNVDIAEDQTLSGPDEVELVIGVFKDNQPNPTDLTIKGYDPSTAKDHAQTYDYSFEAIEYDFEDRGDGTAMITNYRGKTEDLIIPDKLFGLTVTHIGDDAFFNKYLRSVTLPSSIESIGKQAFKQNILSDITLPNGITYIGEEAFVANGIKSITIPESLKVIHKGTFSSMMLEEVIIPEHVTEIQDYAFAYNILSSVTVYSDSVTYGDDVFYRRAELVNPDETTLKANRGSTTEAYAKEKGHTFVALNASSGGGSSGGSGGGGGSTPQPTPPDPEEEQPIVPDESSEQHEQTVAESGGMITFENAQLDIPAGAIQGNVKITIEKVSTLDETWEPEHSSIISDVFELTKDQDGNFQRDITISIPFDMSNVNLDTHYVSLYWLDEATGEWVELDHTSVNMETGTVSGQINHFTKFAVLAKEIFNQDGSYIKGYPNGTFKPDDSLKRADVAIMLARILGYGGEKTNQSFKDVSHDHYAFHEINYLYEIGLIKGYDDANFRPNATITRAEMATVVANYKQFAIEHDIPLTFEDTKGHWAQWTIEATRKSGIINGYTDGTFRPNESITRAEAVTMINRMTDRKPVYGLFEPSFNDVSLTHWALGDIESATRHYRYVIDEQGEHMMVND